MPGMGLTHQRFTDQKTRRTRALEPKYILVGPDAALRNKDDVRRALRSELARKPLGRRQIDFKGLQVSIIHANQIRTQSQRPREFFFVMHFDQHVESKRPRPTVKGLHRRIIERRNNQQDRIGRCDPADCFCAR